MAKKVAFLPWPVAHGWATGHNRLSQGPSQIPIEPKNRDADVSCCGSCPRTHHHGGPNDIIHQSTIPPPPPSASASASALTYHLASARLAQRIERPFPPLSFPASLATADLLPCLYAAQLAERRLPPGTPPPPTVLIRDIVEAIRPCSSRVLWPPAPFAYSSSFPSFPIRYRCQPKWSTAKRTHPRGSSPSTPRPLLMLPRVLPTTASTDDTHNRCFGDKGDVEDITEGSSLSAHTRRPR